MLGYQSRPKEICREDPQPDRDYRTCRVGGVLEHLDAGSGAEPNSGQAESPVEISRSVLREDTIIRLTEMTDHENAQVRANAIEALSLAPSRLDSVLPKALRDENAVCERSLR